MRDRATLIAEIDPNELIVRMLEAARGNTRPPGVTAAELVARLSDDVTTPVRQMAHAAVEYVAECITGAQEVDP